MNLRQLYNNRWVRFSFWAVLYLLWIVWTHLWWWLLGLVVIFDIFITKKVRWAFWKKKYKEGEKPNVLLDWLDAIIFAVLVVTPLNIFFFQSFKIPSSSMESTLMTGDFLFVEKLSYGPRLPQNLSVPFMHNYLPGGGKSYSEKISWKYRRAKGLTEGVRRGDCVVFNFPHGDTVMSKARGEDYYTHVRFNGREYTENAYGPLIVHPYNKADHYVKRCVAVAGDTLEVKDGLVYINGVQQESYPGIQFDYKVVTDGSRINPRTLSKLGVSGSELLYNQTLPGYAYLPLTAEAAAQVEKMPNVAECTPMLDVFPPDYPDSPKMLFPFTNTGWTRDYYGPLWIPRKGATVSLTADNIDIYRRIITVYEGNTLEEKDGRYVINGEECDTYTFAQDYYFMMGDNRHNSLDSRYWGFVPETHIVGRPAFIWLSTDAQERFPNNIRWKRLFNFVLSR